VRVIRPWVRRRAVRGTAMIWAARSRARGQERVPGQDLVDDAQALRFFSGDSLAGVDGVAGALDAGQFLQHQEHAVAGHGASPEVAVAEDDVGRAQGQVA